MPRPISVKDCLKIEEMCPEVCNMARKFPAETREMLSKTKSHTSRLPIGESRKTYEYIRQVTFEIDPLSRQRARESQRESAALPEESQKEIEGILGSETWLNKLAPGHQAAHERYMSLITGRANGDNNG